MSFDELVNRFVPAYKECAARGHDWGKKWWRSSWYHLPWWVPRWRRVRYCKGCKVMIWRRVR